MKRLLVICAAAALALAPTAAFAQGAAKSAAKTATGAAKPKTLTASGTVSAVSSDSLTVKAAAGEMTFSVDAKTKVVGRGMGTKGAALKKDQKPTTITEFVKSGDRVTVTYHDEGTTKHAATVRVARLKASK